MIQYRPATKRRVGLRRRASNDAAAPAMYTAPRPAPSVTSAVPDPLTVSSSSRLEHLTPSLLYASSAPLEGPGSRDYAGERSSYLAGGRALPSDRMGAGPPAYLIPPLQPAIGFEMGHNTPAADQYFQNCIAWSWQRLHAASEPLLRDTAAEGSECGGRSTTRPVRCW